ncbi:MAG: hypothetical protein PHF86_06240 [Candidatus Nanoarchaeia archaeon]|nr:hypothetical protein [Candidatus Nanoarchaeia archaeon]
MALSNWDCLAFNSEAKASIGTFKHFKLKSSITIYKNWAYVSSEEMWCEGGDFTKPTIAAINSGDIQLAGFDIVSIRGPQNGIFIYASCTDYKQEPEKTVYHRFAGIGCAGYKDTVSEVLKTLGREPKDDENWYSGSNHLGEHFIGCHETNEEIVYWDERTQGSYDYSSDWVGVLPSTLEEFFKWLSSLADDYVVDFKEWVENCKKSGALRFNQGDLFFAENAGVELPATKPGESEAPVLNEIIKAMAGDNANE